MSNNRWILVWILAFAINYLSHSLFELNSSSSLELKSIILDTLSRVEVTDLSKAKEYRLRIFWEASVLAYLVAALAASLWGIRTYVKCIGKSLRHPIIWVAAGTIASELFRIGTSGESSASFNTIFCTTYEALEHSPYVTADFMSKASFLIQLINVLAVCAPGFLLMGISAALTIPDSKRRSSLERLIERDSLIDQSVLIGSLMMLMGLIHMGCWMDWPVDIWPDSELKASAIALNASVYAYWGISFSSMLFLVYGGSKWTWKKTVMDVLANNHPDIDPVLFVTDHDLGFQIRRHLPHALAIVLPVLSSMAGSGSNILTMH